MTNSANQPSQTWIKNESYPENTLAHSQNGVQVIQNLEEKLHTLEQEY